jgi:sRNA-binding protein
MAHAHRRPLKLGISDDLQPLVSFPEEDLKAALMRYVRSDGYLKACTEGTLRIDLDGNRERLQLEKAARAKKASPQQPKPLGLKDLKATAERRHFCQAEAESCGGRTTEY